MSFKVPELSYDYNALEPYIDEETMHFHHDKHHAAYVNMLNGAVEAAENLEGKTVEELITDLDSVPEAQRNTVIDFWLKKIVVPDEYFNLVSLSNILREFRDSSKYLKLSKDRKSGV